MRQTIFTTPEQKKMIVYAMENHRKTIKGKMNKKMFDIALDKMKEMRGSVELDGMELIYVSQSLRTQAKSLIATGKAHSALVFRKLGDTVELIRTDFFKDVVLSIKKSS